ncbi:hypothetical protein EVAR_42544_1 [Eumeta japonica]|uniref:Uncharacterized protein n=1 Tax=Eumeta variegata TaxID=151549 RepID=A0A4C1WQQ7_EUMVA|nr:hypothetical protein EVAR_42544_1 [Eumeta japonica]
MFGHIASVGVIGWSAARCAAVQYLRASFAINYNQLCVGVKYVDPLGRAKEGRTDPTVSFERPTVTLKQEITLTCLRKFRFENSIHLSTLFQNGQQLSGRSNNTPSTVILSYLYVSVEGMRSVAVLERAAPYDVTRRVKSQLAEF